MKVFIEGEKYEASYLKEVFDDPKFYRQEGAYGTIISVGYYHSYTKEEIVYMLPKVFIKEDNITIFGIVKDDLINIESLTSFKHQNQYQWIRQLLVYFYFSLLEFRKRNTETSIVQLSASAVLNSNIGTQEFSYLDLLLSFVNFYKRNKNTILYKHIEFKSTQHKKPNWDRTVRKSLPFLTKNKIPIYTAYQIKKRK